LGNDFGRVLQVRVHGHNGVAARGFQSGREGQLMAEVPRELYAYIHRITATLGGDDLPAPVFAPVVHEHDFQAPGVAERTAANAIQFLEEQGQAYVLRVASNFILTLTAGTAMTCADAVRKLLTRKRDWEVRSAGRGSKGERWYAWAWLATASPKHTVLVRRHLKTGELAFHYCFVPDGQLAPKARLIRAAGLRWPVEESFQLGKGCFGLDQCQARLYTAVLRHIVLVMAALAVCAVTAAQLRERTDTQAAPPVRPGDAPPADPGLIPLSVREIRRLLAAELSRSKPPGHAARWLEWRRRHQARSRWFHKRARLERNYALVS